MRIRGLVRSSVALLAAATIALPNMAAAQMGCLQKFAAIHSSVYNHFNQERHLYNRANFKLNRAAALAEWRQLNAE